MSLLDLNPSLVMGSVGGVGGDDGGGLGRLLLGVSVRLHSNACLEAKPVRALLQAERQAYIFGVASSHSQGEI